MRYMQPKRLVDMTNEEKAANWAETENMLAVHIIANVDGLSWNKAVEISKLVMKTVFADAYALVKDPFEDTHKGL